MAFRKLRPKAGGLTFTTIHLSITLPNLEENGKEENSWLTKNFFGKLVIVFTFSSKFVIITLSIEEFRKRGESNMRHALAYETVGLCQACGEPLTSRDVLQTGQARFCPECVESSKKQAAAVV